MDTPFIGEIRITSFDFAPRGWALCNGQLLPINQNQALFALLGTMYGGNGQTNFALPDMRGRVPIHTGTYTQGARLGQENHTLTQSEMPAHVHAITVNAVKVTGADADATTVAGNSPAPALGGDIFGDMINVDPYGTSANTTMSSNAAQGTMSNTGGSQPHNNMQPYLVVNYIIALQGVFPSAN